MMDLNTESWRPCEEVSSGDNSLRRRRQEELASRPQYCHNQTVDTCWARKSEAIYSPPIVRHKVSGPRSVNRNYWLRRKRDLGGCVTGLLVLLVGASVILKVQAQDVSSIQPPSQLFLESSSGRAMGSLFSFAVGRQASKERPKEEEEGFIMETATTTTALPADHETSSSHLDGTQQQWNSSSQEESNNNNNENQRIPIDAARQQFLTHDQLLSQVPPAPRDDSQPMADRTTSSRAGLSKVSHVTSFLSDLFSFASLRPRDQSTGSQSQSQRPAEEPTLASKPNNRAAPKPVVSSSSSSSSSSPTSTPATCPGVCKSIITASLLCRNEIPGAPCPSILQRCCERDDGGLASAFIGTPVETSASIGAGEPPEGSPTAPPTTLAPQTRLPPSQPNTGKHLPSDGDGQSLSAAAAALSDAGAPASSSEVPASISDSQQQHQQHGPVLYFLSSLNSSAAQSHNTNKQQPPVHHQGDQSSDGEQPTGASSDGGRPRQTSQSFDSPVTSGGAPSQQVAASSGADDQRRPPVWLQTVNGTIIHPPAAAGGLSHRLRPAVVYANWSDYHHMTMHRPQQPNQQTFVYHSNIDPVKRLIAVDVAPHNVTSASAETTTTTTAPDITSKPTSIKRILIMTDPYKSRYSGNTQQQQQQQSQQAQILNDQHSRQYSSEYADSSGAEASMSSPTTTTTTTTSTAPTTTSTASATTTTELLPDPSADLSQSVASGVGSVLVNLIESWMSASPATTTPPPSYYDDSSYQQLTTFAGPTDQQSERNQQQSTGYLNSSTSDDEGSYLGADQQDKCQGYCTLALFTMLCDSTYRSSDCDTNQKCCVINSSTNSKATDLSPQQQSTPTQMVKQSMCRGDCLSVYHSSICVKPNELIDSSSCLPGFVCCSPPTAGHQGLSVSKLDETYSIDRPDQLSADGSSSDPVRESSSFLASLLPPLPPSLAGETSQSSAGAHKVSEQQHMTATGYRGSGGNPANVQSNGDQKRGGNHQKSGGGNGQSGGGGGGIMSHIYQIFKPRQKNQQQASQQPAQITPAIVAQLHDPYALQLASIRQGLGNIQQSPLLYPAHMLALAPGFTGHVPASLGPNHHQQQHHHHQNYQQVLQPIDAAATMVKEAPVQSLNRVVPNQIIALSSDQHTPGSLAMSHAYGILGSQAQPPIYHQQQQPQPHQPHPQSFQSQSQLHHLQQQQQQQQLASINKLSQSALIEAGQQLGLSAESSQQLGLIVNGLASANSQHLRTGGVMGQFPANNGAPGSTIVGGGQSSGAGDRPRNNNQQQQQQQQQMDNTHAQATHKAVAHNWSLSPFGPADARQKGPTPSKAFVAQQQQQQPLQQQQPQQQQQVTVTRPPMVKQEQQVERTQPRQPATCGLPGTFSKSGGREGRVMGGFEAKPNYWCWMGALMNSRNEYLCGGALIGSKWVLTSAHCVTQHLRDASQLFVKLGQHNLNSSESSFARTVQVKTSYVHHSHNSITLDNDIALLRLEEAVDLDEPNICTVCLPERTSKLEPGKRCTVTGYGFENESGPAALKVRQTDLPVVGDAECQRRASSLLGKPFALPASSFCAGGELGQDACHGDGGSPLSCLVDGYYELAGIVSWGYKCGSKDLPGLYSKVSAFVGWINQIVSVNN